MNNNLFYLNPPAFLQKDWEVSQDQYFCNIDNYETFKKNQKIFGKQWHYTSKEIVYNINSNGYRNSEWAQVDWANSAVILGCSMVAGIGVAEDETLGYYLSELSNMPVVNLGSPGASIEFIFYNSTILKKYYPKPKAVIVLWSSMDRLTRFTSWGIDNLGIWDFDKDQYYKSHVEHEENFSIKSKFLIWATELMWHDTNFYHASYFEETTVAMQIDRLYNYKDGRDLIHPGSKTNLKTAELINNRLKAKQ